VLHRDRARTSGKLGSVDNTRSLSPASRQCRWRSSGPTTRHAQSLQRQACASANRSGRRDAPATNYWDPANIQVTVTFAAVVR
jgi:hypothetical protein